MTNYYNFKTEKEPELQEVGGKAKSLIHLTGGNFNVPAGAVLSVGFFKKWLLELTALTDFNKMIKNPESFKELSKKLKEAARDLEFSKEQKAIVENIYNTIGNDKKVAVRSSSPEEDLAGASFAGGYETVLGVVKDTVFQAIKKAFISCLDERVFFYKHQNGFDTSVLRIAVIIQQQIYSEASGVGFSLNPLNNAYDEGVINANTGLGESVVSGMVTPDEFTVDKHSLNIMEKNLGSKEQAIVLDEHKGTKTVAGLKDKFALTDEQVLEVTRLICAVEKYYGFPVDIEWAFAKGTLYLLQSRPITTYVPLPEELQTKPGEEKLLFMDGSLIKQGITTPISVLGCDCIEQTQRVMFEGMLGKDVVSDAKGGLASTRGGRMYVNLSSSMRFQGKKKVLDMFRTVDVTTVELMESLDVTPYIPGKLPKPLKGALWGAIKNNFGAIFKTLKALKKPDEYKSWYDPFEKEFDRYLLDIVKQDLPLSEVPTLIFEQFIGLLDKMLPMTYAAELSRSKIKKILEKQFTDGLEKMQYLERSLPDNSTIQMGLTMYDLSQMTEIKDHSYEEFKRLLDEGKVSEKFKTLWDFYLKTFGCRTANELDTGVARSYEKLGELFGQIKNMSQVADDFNPYSIYEKSKKLREDTYEQVITSIKNKSVVKTFKKYYRNLVTLGSKREDLKYWYIRSLDAVRQIALRKGLLLQAKGLIKTVDDIFWLKLQEVDRAFSMKPAEIEAKIEKNKSYYRVLEQVHNFPRLIDSRGKILTFPPRETKEGELSGQPISPGTVTGRVKVLAAPDEKPLLPGEIMVTRATDPGWTPLFINAGAIILEVGGLLQHGALVAREYGKPCIAGIENVTSILKDGQLVEVDAARGIIKIVENNDE